MNTTSPPDVLRIDQVQAALKDAADNYVTVVCNSQQLELEEVLEDPVVKRWYELASLTLPDTTCNPVPNLDLAKRKGWTHQVQWHAHNGNCPNSGRAYWVSCFSRKTSKEAAERHADELRQDPLNSDVVVCEIPGATQ